MPSQKIDSHVPEARAFISRLTRTVPITTVVIDNWRGAIRLIYGGPNTPKCPSSCQQCPLFIAVGPDNPKWIDRKEEVENKLHFVRTLVKPDVPKDSILNPNVRSFVNCMSLAQYVNFYIAWLLKECELEREIADELKLVEGMRIVYHLGVMNLTDLEIAIKRMIVESAIWHMSDEDPRIPLVIKHATQLGLI